MRFTRVGAWLSQVLLRHERTTFWQRFSQSLQQPLFWVFLIGGIFVTDKLTHLGVFEYAAMREQDVLMREVAATRSQISTQIRIVNITREDFDRHFDGRIPLDPDKLAELVCELARRSPRLLIVDIDTSDDRFSKMAFPRGGLKPILWARGTEGTSEPLTAMKVLGQADPPEGQDSGLAVSFLASDWSIREYPRLIQTTAQARARSLHWEAFCTLSEEDGRCEDDTLGALEVPAFERFIDFQRFPALRRPAGHGNSGLSAGRRVRPGSRFSLARMGQVCVEVRARVTGCWSLLALPPDTSSLYHSRVDRRAGLEGRLASVSPSELPSFVSTVCARNVVGADDWHGRKGASSGT